MPAQLAGGPHRLPSVTPAGEVLAALASKPKQHTSEARQSAGSSHCSDAPSQVELAL
jgi:hypothetical protein